MQQQCERFKRWGTVVDLHPSSLVWSCWYWQGCHVLRVATSSTKVGTKQSEVSFKPDAPLSTYYEYTRSNWWQSVCCCSDSSFLVTSKYFMFFCGVVFFFLKIFFLIYFLFGFFLSDFFVNFPQYSKIQKRAQYNLVKMPNLPSTLSESTNVLQKSQKPLISILSVKKRYSQQLWQSQRQCSCQTSTFQPNFSWRLCDRMSMGMGKSVYGTWSPLWCF